MKKVFCIIYLLFFIVVSASAKDVEYPQKQSQGQNATNIEESQYTFSWFDCFIYDDENEYFKFVPIEKAGYKILSKNEKQDYKKIKKIHNYLARNKFVKAINTDDEFLPTYFNAYKFSNDNNEYIYALYYWQKVMQLNQTVKYFEQDSLKPTLAELFFYTNQFDKFITTIKPFMQQKEYQIPKYYFLLAEAYNNIKDFNNSILYAKKLETNNDYKLDAYKLLYNDYFRLRNLTQARFYAIKLASLQPCALNYYKVILSTQSKNEKLKYYYLIADEYINVGTKEKDTEALSIMYNDIIPLENEKIKNAAKNIKGFVELPDYKIIFDNDYKYMTALKSYNRCKNFYMATNNGIAKYKGNDLKNCFNSILKNEQNITDRLIAEQRALEQRYAEQQRLQQLRLMNANMQYNNYLQQQRNYELSRPRYTNTTITPIGNTYYMNSYSY